MERTKRKRIYSGVMRKKEFIVAVRGRYRSSALLLSSSSSSSESESPSPSPPPGSPIAMKYILFQTLNFKNETQWFAFGLSRTSNSSIKSTSIHNCRSHPFGRFEKTNLTCFTKLKKEYLISTDRFVSIGSFIYSIHNHFQSPCLFKSTIFRFDLNRREDGWKRISPPMTRWCGGNLSTAHTLVIGTQIYLFSSILPDHAPAAPCAIVFDLNSRKWDSLPGPPAGSEEIRRGGNIGFAVLEDANTILAYFSSDFTISSGLYAYDLLKKSWRVYDRNVTTNYANSNRLAVVVDRTLYWFTDNSYTAVGINAYDLDKKMWFFSDIKDFCELVLHERNTREDSLFHLGGQNFCLLLKDGHDHMVSGSCFSCIRSCRLRVSKHINSRGEGILNTTFESVQSYFLPGPMNINDTRLSDEILGGEETSKGGSESGKAVCDLWRSGR